MSKRKSAEAQESAKALHPDGEKAKSGNFFYDRSTGRVMGRNGKEWCQLFIFYIIFYACLFAFWTACLFGFLSTTNLELPTLTGYDSMLQLNPAIGYRPQPDFEKNLIKFNSSDKSTYSAFVNDMDNYLEPYFNVTLQNSLLDCRNGVKSDANNACRFHPRVVAPKCFEPGSRDSDFHFSSAQPCIFLKMNRIIGWLPRNYPNGEYHDVRIRCYGENEADDETLGEITYYPGGKDVNGTYGIIPSYYFPFMNQPNYLSPLVFAHFKNIKFYTLALIWCEFDREDVDFVEGTYWVSRALNERAGGAHFELVVDV